MESREDRLEAALREISETPPREDLNTECRVNDPAAIMWNVHRIAMIALGDLDDHGRTRGFKS